MLWHKGRFLFHYDELFKKKKSLFFRTAKRGKNVLASWGRLQIWGMVP